MDRDQVDQKQPFSYKVTEDSSVSLIDAFSYLLLKADSTTYLSKHLEADDLPPPILKLLETIKKTHSLEGSPAQLEDLAFPLPHLLNADKPTAGPKQDHSKVLSNVMKYIEYHFETAKFRLDDSSDAPEIEAALQSFLDTTPDFEDNDVAALVRYLYLDLIPTPGGKTSLPLEDQFAKVKEKQLQIKSDFQQTTKFTKTKLFLLREMNRRFLLHFNPEFSTEFDAILTSASKRQQQKLLELNPVDQLSKLSSRYDQMIIDHRFERFDLINQVSTGLVDIKTNFLLETKTFEIRWVASIKNSTSIYNFKFKTVSRCELSNSLTKYKALYPCCSVWQMMARYLADSQRGANTHNIEIHDYDYLAVYFDSKQAMYRYIPEHNSFVDAEAQITIFNENSKTINHPSTIRILFSAFYRQNIPNSDKVTFLFTDHNRNKTLKDLLIFARDTIDPDINISEVDPESVKQIWFALKADFKSLDQLKQAEEHSRNFGFNLSTPVSKIVEVFWAGNEFASKSENFIDLVCFKSLLFADGEAAKMQTRHSQHNMSDLVITRMLTVEGILTYLFRIGEERYIKTSGEDEKNKFKNYDVTFFLPNQLFVDVRTVTTKIEHAEDIELTFLTDHVEEEHRHLIESNYSVKGGIMAVLEDNKQQFFRPFIIERDSKNLPKFMMITPRLTPQVPFNMDAHSTDICFLFYERKTNQ